MQAQAAAAQLRLARCGRCGGHSFPAGVYGCLRCGAPAAELQAVPCPQPPRLLNWVTLHAELAPGLRVPCVIGEVELAPAVVEEALIDVAQVSGLHPGLELQAHREEGDVQWRFRPAGSAP